MPDATTVNTKHAKKHEKNVKNAVNATETGSDVIIITSAIVAAIIMTEMSILTATTDTHCSASAEQYH